jgi:peptide/nickel transport system permease protein
LSKTDDVVEVVQRTPRQIAWARFKRNRAGVISGYVALIFIIAAFAAPIITKLLGLKNGQTYPDAIDGQSFPIGRFGGMSLAHPLGVEPGAAA